MHSVVKQVVERTVGDRCVYLSTEENPTHKPAALTER
jgi:hypothetical protein